MRLTYANVMSTIAVFLVIGGASALAATQLAKNSVGTKQLKKNAVTAAKIKKKAVTAAKIKKNAVTTAKVKNDAVTGSKVNEATLGTVPSATLANSIPPAEPTHYVGAPGEPAFENGSSNVGSLEGLVKLNNVGFYKDHEGIVHLEGVARVGKGEEGKAVPLFTLPPGYRPTAGNIIIQAPIETAPALIGGTGANFAGTDLSGKVAGTGGEEKLAVLDGITYRAAS
jgi:hypothetical protein